MLDLRQRCSAPASSRCRVAPAGRFAIAPARRVHVRRTAALLDPGHRCTPSPTLVRRHARSPWPSAAPPSCRAPAGSPQVVSWSSAASAFAWLRHRRSRRSMVHGGRTPVALLARRGRAWGGRAEAPEDRRSPRSPEILAVGDAGRADAPSGAGGAGREGRPSPALLGRLTAHMLIALALSQGVQRCRVFVHAFTCAWGPLPRLASC